MTDAKGRRNQKNKEGRKVGKRMRAFRVAGYFAATLVCTATASAAAPIDTIAVDRIVRDALRAWQVPGVAVAILRGDDGVYLKGLAAKETRRDGGVRPGTLFSLSPRAQE